MNFFFIEPGFYNKAVEVAPNVSEEFDKELSERNCWGLNHLRSYFRAVHGQANTLRKMGRYEESLKKYLLLEKLDPKFYRYCFVNKSYLLRKNHLCRDEFLFWSKKRLVITEGTCFRASGFFLPFGTFIYNATYQAHRQLIEFGQ